MDRKLFLLTMLVIMTSMLAGTTYSFFTDSSSPLDVVFITGSNTVEIVESNLMKSIDENGGAEFTDWKPGKENAVFISWKFVNTGDQDSCYRVKINAGWEHGEDNVVHWIQTGENTWTEEDGGNMIYGYQIPVTQGEEVVLSFGVWCESILGVDNADYLIDLEVISSQATD